MLESNYRGSRRPLRRRSLRSLPLGARFRSLIMVKRVHAGAILLSHVILGDDRRLLRCCVRSDEAVGGDADDQQNQQRDRQRGGFAAAQIGVLDVGAVRAEEKPLHQIDEEPRGPQPGQHDHGEIPRDRERPVRQHLHQSRKEAEGGKPHRGGHQESEQEGEAGHRLREPADPVEIQIAVARPHPPPGEEEPPRDQRRGAGVERPPRRAAGRAGEIPPKNREEGDPAVGEQPLHPELGDRLDHSIERAEEGEEADRPADLRRNLRKEPADRVESCQRKKNGEQRGENPRQPSQRRHIEPVQRKEGKEENGDSEDREISGGEIVHLRGGGEKPAEGGGERDQTDGDFKGQALIEPAGPSIESASQPRIKRFQIRPVQEENVEAGHQRLGPLRHPDRDAVGPCIDHHPAGDDQQRRHRDQKVEEPSVQRGRLEIARRLARPGIEKVGQPLRRVEIGHDHQEHRKEHERRHLPRRHRPQAVEGQDRLRGGDPDEEEKDHHPMGIDQGDSKHAVCRKDEDEREDEGHEESGPPGEAREILLLQGELHLIVLVVQRRVSRLPAGRMDDMAAVEEDGRFEEAVRDEVEDGEGEAPQPALHDHVAHLPDRGVGQCLFNVVLRQHHRRPEERGHRADHQGDMERDGAEAVERGEPVHEEAAGVDDPGVQQGGHRRRGVEVSGQPGVHRELDRLAHRADEDQQGDDRRRADRKSAERKALLHLGRFDEELREFEGAVGAVGEDDPGQKGDVSDPEDGIGFSGRLHRRGMGIVVDEQVEQPTDELPEDEEHQKVAAGDHAEEDHGHQVEEAVEPGAAALLLHVANGETEDEKADGADQRQHDGGEAVDIEAELEEAAVGGGEGNVDRLRARAGLVEDEKGDRERRHLRGAADPIGLPADLPFEKADRDGRGKRPQKDQQWVVRNRHLPPWFVISIVNAGKKRR